MIAKKKIIEHVSGSWCIVFSFAFFILAFLPLKMPRYYEDNVEETTLVEKVKIFEIIFYECEVYLFI